MKLKKKLFNILSAALVVVAYSSTNPWGSFGLFGESEIPENLMED
ncbi:AgrD family cyclic lactone autoinducer peptide [Clostridium sp. UBA1652]|nr:cyclic lactone autoinducer peptide [Clostridium sp. UBA1652]